MAEYLKRVVDEELNLHLETSGAVLIVGPKWCGKTTCAEQRAMSILRLQDPEIREGYLATAETKPSLLLRGAKPRLIDEWQEAPVLWDAIRLEVDRRQEEGLFILTGSTTVDKGKIIHTGTGRIARMKMYPMSLFESGESNGSISLRELFEDPDKEIEMTSSNLSVEELIYAACRGGWPGALRRKNEAARLQIAKDYLEAICESDISTVDSVRRNPRWTRLILNSYARNLSTPAKTSSIHRDVAGNAETMTLATMNSYVSALEKLFVIEDIEAWCPAVRSATAIRSSAKREFIDPSIAVAALGMKPDYLQQDMKTFGFIFECLCIRDLKVYSQALGGKLSYYRDRYGLEADAVLHLTDGKYALIEFKMGSREIDEGAKHLQILADLIRKHNETERQVPLREPDLLLVITGGQFAYTRPDGVKVIPIGCLKG